jgi:hypothetical protein
VTPLLLLAWQAAAGPPAAVPPRPRSDRPCLPGLDDEVVVCARTGDSPYRLRRLPERYSTAPDALPKAQVAALGGTVSVEGEQGADAQGGPINRAMVRFRLPLGRKPR